MEQFNVWSFMNTIVSVCIDAFESLWNILFTNIEVFQLFNWIIKVIEFFGGTAPSWLYTLGNVQINIITLGGVSLGVILIVVLVKKIIPLF